MEFIASFVFISTWLIVKTYEMPGEFTRWQSIIKPAFIGLVYFGCQAITSATSNGPINATLAGQLWMWSAIAYDDNMINNLNVVNKYDFYHYGRYAWVYIVANVLAGVLAAPFAKRHFDKLAGVLNQDPEL